MRIKNTERRYGIVTISLHWLMAILIIGLVAVGLYMTRIPISLEKLKLYGWHKEYGILVLMLAMLRIVWRIGNISPLLPDTLPLWQKFGAHAVHWAFYGFMFALPITGWLLTNAAGLPVSFFGLFVLPDPISADPNLQHLFTEIHKWLAYGLILTFCAHVGAALKHHFINKDDILRRIFW
jgi:cytochrome b561